MKTAVMARNCPSSERRRRCSRPDLPIGGHPHAPPPIGPELIDGGGRGGRQGLRSGHAGDGHVGQAGDTGDGDRHTPAGHEVRRVGGDLGRGTGEPGTGQGARSQRRSPGLWASAGSAWTTAAWTPARAADSTSPWAESTRPRATMRTMTMSRTGATMTSSAMAWPSSPRTSTAAGHPLVRYSWIGALLVADTVRSSQGMRAWARPVTVTWATSPDSGGGDNLWIGQGAGPGGGDEPLGGLSSGS